MTCPAYTRATEGVNWLPAADVSLLIVMMKAGAACVRCGAALRAGAIAARDGTGAADAAFVAAGATLLTGDGELASPSPFCTVSLKSSTSPEPVLLSDAHAPSRTA